MKKSNAMKTKSITKRKNTRPKNRFKLFLDALKSFTIKKAFADFDTGDFPLNAQLIPVTQQVNNRNINLQVNFENRNIIDIEIFTRLYKLLWLGLKNKLITSNK